jgi:hypothetical protein
LANVACCGRALALQVLHAITAAAWRHLHEMRPDAFCNTLYGFGLLNFHPGEAGSRSVVCCALQRACLPVLQLQLHYGMLLSVSSAQPHASWPAGEQFMDAAAARMKQLLPDMTAQQGEGPPSLACCTGDGLTGCGLTWHALAANVCCA